MAAGVKVDRNKAKELLVKLGLKTATRYSDAKLLGMLTKLDATDDTADPGKHAKLYEKVIKANQDEKELILTGDNDEGEEDEKPAKGKKAKVVKGKAAKKVEPEEDEEEEDDEEEDDDEEDEEEEDEKPAKGKKAKSSKNKTSGGEGARQMDAEGRTAKDRVYLEWLKQGGKELPHEDTDYDGIAETAEATDKAKSTIRGWISAWRFDKGLPRIAKRIEAGEVDAPKAKKAKKGKKK